MASRHSKRGFGTKVCYLQGIRARQSARYIDGGMMRAQKPNTVGALANIIKPQPAKSQDLSVQHSLDSSRQKFYSENNNKTLKMSHCVSQVFST